MMIGVDYHPSFQQIAFFVEDTVECGEQQLQGNSLLSSEWWRLHRRPQEAFAGALSNEAVTV